MFKERNTLCWVLHWRDHSLQIPICISRSTYMIWYIDQHNFTSPVNTHTHTHTPVPSLGLKKFRPICQWMFTSIYHQLSCREASFYGAVHQWSHSGLALPFPAKVLGGRLKALKLMQIRVQPYPPAQSCMTTAASKRAGWVPAYRWELAKAVLPSQETA